MAWYSSLTDQALGRTPISGRVADTCVGKPTTRGKARVKRQGFSLIELLVVIAIIGILAAIGLIVYNDYITGVKSDTVANQDREFARYLNTTDVVVKAELKGPEWMESDPNTRTRCDVYVAALVSKMNVDLSNPFNSAIPAYKDGHTDPAYPAQQEVAGGQTLVFCVDPTVSTQQTAIITCANTSAETATTTGSLLDPSNWTDLDGDSEVDVPEIKPGRCPDPGTG